MESVPRVQLYVATSLDGYIASPEGNIDWLEQFDTEDDGYETFMESVGTLIMGRTTYDKILTFGQWAYGDRETYVITHRTEEQPSTPNTLFYSGDLEELIDNIHSKQTKNIWLVGGAETVKQFLELDLLNDILVHTMPILLGKGISLFPQMDRSTLLKLERSQQFASGAVMMHYVIE
jgi:dihydrofolate reductase